MSTNMRAFHFWLVALLFVLSGLSSLIYQVIWTRLLIFVFGSTSFATATVLAVFMGGLALGSFVAGRIADRIKNPFLLYGILEGVIGLFALFAPLLFDSFIPFYRLLWQSMHLSVLPFNLIRFTIVALILLIPTACMGATLPLLAKFVTASLEEVGERVGILYSMNTFGAILGTLLAGFLLIPNLGLWLTIVIAASINFALLLVVFLLAGKWKPQQNEPETQVVLQEKLPLEVKVVLISFAASGAIAMIYEVTWTRCLLMVVGSTTYAFSIMLSTFLIGIFLGGLFFARLADKVKNPLIWFGCFQVLLCLGGFLSIWLFNMLPYWNLAANIYWRGLPSMGMLVRFCLCGLVLLPITFCLGAIFPFAVKSCARSLEKLGRSIGTLYSANTLGAICGAFAGGFIIVPLFGSEKTLILSAVTNLVLGVAILLYFGAMRPGVKIFVRIATAAVVVWACVAPGIWDPVAILLSQSARRNFIHLQAANLPSYTDWIAMLHKVRQVEFWKDGLCAHVAIMRNLENGHLALLTNGHVDASDWHDMPTQQLISVFPQLFRSKNDDVAIIGWGSGVTVGYSLLFPAKKVVCAEIEPEVVNAARCFNRVNLNPENDPRLVIEANDGRNYLLAAKDNFDVIISEPSNPWQSGVCNLFTKEYFQICHDRLKPGGVFSLWCQSGEVSSENIMRVLKALHQVFDHVMVFAINDVDTCVVASDGPLTLDLKAVNTLMEAPRLKAKLKDIGIRSADDIAARIYMVQPAIDALSGSVQANTDDMNYMEYDVAKTYEQKSFIADNARWFLRNGGPLWDGINWDGYSRQEKAKTMAAIAGDCMALSPGRAIRWAEASSALEPNASAYITAGMAYSLNGDHQQALKNLDQALKMEPQSLKATEARGLLRLRAGESLLARQDFESLLQKQPDNLIVRYRLAQAYSSVFADDRKYSDQSLYSADYAKEAGLSNPKKVSALLTPLAANAKFIAQHPGVTLLLGQSLLDAGQSQEALSLVERYLAVEKQDPFAWRILGNIYAAKGGKQQAQICFQQALLLENQMATPMLDVAEKLIADNKNAEAAIVLNKVKVLAPGNAKMQMLQAKLAQGGA